MLRKPLAAVRNKKGQQTIEFLLLLASVVSFVMVFVLTFNKQILGGFFTVIGKIIQ